MDRKLSLNGAAKGNYNIVVHLPEGTYTTKMIVEQAVKNHKRFYKKNPGNFLAGIFGMGEIFLRISFSSQ